MSAAKQSTWVVDWNSGYGSPSIWAGSAPSGHGPAGELIATVHGDNARTEDHARLIGAAPDLLTALQDLMPTFDVLERNGYRIDPMQVNAARAAIAKAEGGAS